jgi:DNA repair protein RadA/Sms
MAKTRTVFVCQQCGAHQAREMGRCPNCGGWGTLVEQIERREAPASNRRSVVVSGAGAPLPLHAIPSGGVSRLPVVYQEFARVLGGGLVPGSLVLIGGEPGIGKSSLLLQSAAHFAEHVGDALYISAEESAQQIKLRADRMGLNPERLWISSETNLETAISYIDSQRPGLVIVDSIQTVYIEELSSAAGSVGQVREGALRLLRVAKDLNIPIIIVGHVTKEGAIAGPRMLEHIVDVVLYLEGERFHQYRILRGVKNRYGSTDEVGIFEMTATGLHEISNPSQVFLAERSANTPGSAVAVTLEGTRPILVEIQGLTSNTANPQPRRTVNGYDLNRLQMLLAVLGKRVGLPLFNQDVYVNIVGGLRIGEPAADLAVATAIASSFRNQRVASDMVLMGEIGLSGEMRSVTQIERRLGEAAKLGFSKAVCPPLQTPVHIEGMQITQVKSVFDAIEAALGPAPRRKNRDDDE